MFIDENRIANHNNNRRGGREKDIFSTSYKTALGGHVTGQQLGTVPGISFYLTLPHGLQTYRIRKSMPPVYAIQPEICPLVSMHSLSFWVF